MMGTRISSRRLIRSCVATDSRPPSSWSPTALEKESLGKENGYSLADLGTSRSLCEDGISFGSHTCTHPHLLSLSDEQVQHELTASKERLEARLGREIPFVAYPYGESSSEIRRMAMQRGYRAACGVITE